MINKAFMQYYWDKILTEARFDEKKMDHKIASLCVQFHKVFKIYPEEAGLLRLKPPFHNSISILRFICGYLPGIANYFWETTDTLEQKIKFVNASKETTLLKPVDNAQLKSDKYNINSSKRVLKRCDSKRASVKALYEGYNLSNQWGKQK